MALFTIFERIANGIIRRYRWYVVHPKARRPYQEINILNSFDSIKFILDKKCSVSRYGDGELSFFVGIKEGYQEVDEDMVARLKHVLLATDAPNHVVGLPYHLKNVKGTVVLSRTFWGDLVCKYGSYWLQFFSKDRMYIDTQISRFYKAYHDVNRSAKQLALLKKIWEGREMVIIEGCQSRTGVGNDLYDNAKSVERILGYATNAFSHYDEMLNAITAHVKPEEGKLIFLSYGPSATILAYDLAKMGYQAIDIGHLDIEYEWYLQAKNGNTSAEKSVIKGKYTNEAAGGDVVEECNDEKYLSEIICDITK